MHAAMQPRRPTTCTLATSSTLVRRGPPARPASGARGGGRARGRPAAGVLVLPVPVAPTRRGV